jgi:hypothetical protein
VPDTETHEWEAIRAAAIEAVRAAITVPWPDSDVEEVADAVLAVCDEEAINRMADVFVNETRIRAMDFRNGVDMDLVPSQTLVANWVAAAKTWLDDAGARNYTETAVEFPGEKVSVEVKLAGEAERFVFILQRVGPGKLTPHEARKQADERADAAVRLLEEAFHLRMNGERAPGGNETWRDWDRKCETFLRDIDATKGSECGS